MADPDSSSVKDPGLFLHAEEIYNPDVFGKLSAAVFNGSDRSQVYTVYRKIERKPEEIFLKGGTYGL